MIEEYGSKYSRSFCIEKGYVDLYFFIIRCDLNMDLLFYIITCNLNVHLYFRILHEI